MTPPNPPLRKAKHCCSRILPFRGREGPGTSLSPAGCWLFPESRLVPEKLLPCPQPQRPLGVQQAFLAQTLEKCQGPCAGDQGGCLEEGDSENRGQGPPDECFPPLAESFREEGVS